MSYITICCLSFGLSQVDQRVVFKVELQVKNGKVVTVKMTPIANVYVKLQIQG